jgi:uncharacterized protein with HEPN domain
MQRFGHEVRRALRCHASSAKPHILSSEAAVAQARSTQPTDVSQYQALQAYSAAVESTCSIVGETVGQFDATLRLVSFIQDVRVKTWADMKAALTRQVPTYASAFTASYLLDSDLLDAAEALQWPKPVDWSRVSEADRAAFSKTFRRLLEFQVMQVCST